MNERKFTKAALYIINMYYDWSKVDSYPCPIKIVISRRGLGKTFGKLKSFVERTIHNGKYFIYVVETGDMIKELGRNNGEKFWSAILDFYSKCDTSRKRYFNRLLNDTEIVIDENNEEEIFKPNTKLINGTIKACGKTIGYIVDMNSFGEIKRNNFTKAKYIIVDEFISEKRDITTLQYPKRISSIVQSIARLNDIQIYLLGNSVRLDDPILMRMKFKLDKYGYYLKYDEEGLLAILHFVNPEDYPEFDKAYNKSVAGRFAKLMGETNEEENKFVSDVPEDKILKDYKLRKGGYSISIIKNDVIVSIRELNDKRYACFPFLNKNCSTLLCMTEKEQGYKDGIHIICNKELKQILLNMLKSNSMYYYSELEYTKLKYILKGD